MNGWDKVTKWAGMGNNRNDGSETDMQEDGVTGEQELAASEASGPEMVEDQKDQKDQREQAEQSAEGTGELARVKAERDQLQDRLHRLQAEFDNARKREAKERQDAREYTIGSTIEPFLGVMDNFQLALKAQGSAEQLRGGVELILKQMDDALKGLQVMPIESIGTQFDPRVHEALGSIETVEFPDHQVMEEIRRGYKIRDKVLRAAMVRIAENKHMVSE